MQKMQRLLYITNKNRCEYLDNLKYYVTTQETGSAILDISLCNIPARRKTICRV